MAHVTGGAAVARIYLGILLLAMAAGQLADLPGFARVLETYRLGGEAFAVAIALALVAGELVGGLWLLGPARFRAPGAVIALVVAIAWTALGVQAFARGLDLGNCGCFGVYLAQELRWWVLVQDAAFIGLAALAWYRVRGGQFRPLASRTGWRLRTSRDAG